MARSINFSQLLEEDLHRWPPARLLAEIQNLCRQWGIWGRKVSLEHEGQTYLVSCEAQAFVIYRLLPPEAKTPGAPGWPVCLVTQDSFIDECSPPYLEEDHFACHLSLADWLAILASRWGNL